jgi:hypothetical protein
VTNLLSKRCFPRWQITIATLQRWRDALTRMQDRIPNANLKETVKRELEKEPPKGPSSQH